MEIKKIIKKFIPLFLLDFYHYLLPIVGAFLYGFPSQKMVVIGITGTNGKTTVADLVVRILEEAGHKVASLSSIKFKVGDKEWPNTLKMTMPGRFRLQKFLKQALNAGCEYAVLEVTSEGIKQYRHKFIDFDMAVFTNLTPEHIESHGSFEKYREAKGRLFQATKKIHVINLDDENVEYFLQFPAGQKYGYRVRNQESGIRNQESNRNLKVIEAEKVEIKGNYSSFFIHNSKFIIHLLGKFNIDNALAAICVGLSQDIDLEICKKALEKAKGIPGRMEMVISSPYKVFVDYAFTPAALEKVYQTLKPEASRMICLLGACGGGRDEWKRPVLGKIAGKYCDEIVITNEDPYDEDPLEIIEQVAKGTGNKAKKILDRREAIKQALKLANSGDIAVITGKGCEPWICVAKGKKIPWDDRKVVKEEFQKLI